MLIMQLCICELFYFDKFVALGEHVGMNYQVLTFSYHVGYFLFGCCGFRMDH